MSIKAPDLEWLQGDVPRAEGFNDTYFSKAGGLAETRHVFLQGNGLPGRFDGCERFTIAEFGFGKRGGSCGRVRAVYEHPLRRPG